MELSGFNEVVRVFVGVFFLQFEGIRIGFFWELWLVVGGRLADVHK